MNWTHVHLMLNHVPVLGTVFGFALLAWALMRRNETLQRVALWTFVLAAVAAIPVFLTGEPAEEMVENLAGTAERAIETHEEAGLVALIAVEAVGVLALAALLWFRQRALPRALIAVTVALALATAGWMVYTANVGGQIRHSELRAGGTQAPDTEDEGDDEAEAP